MNILTLNSGSNSLKFEVVMAEPNYGAPDSEGSFGSSLLAGSFDNIGKQDSIFSVTQNKKKVQEENVAVRDHGSATQLLFDWLEQGNAKTHGIGGLSDIHRVGHRIVHGADIFHKPVEIDDKVVAQIEGLEDLAPLHNASALEVIRAAQARSGFGALMVAVFDTVFHRHIPDYAALYPLPQDVAARHRIRRYGFHGISHRYMSIRYAQITGRPFRAMKLVTLHLEGGSSVAAISNGHSMDTSMGFTPLEGLMMGTRCGDIDPSIVSYLMRKENMASHQIESFLNKQCGLLGVSKQSADTRELVKKLDDGAVALAVEMFCHRVRKYVGAYLAALGGAEAIVLGGGISENTPLIRERLFHDFTWSGAIFDAGRNTQVVDVEGSICTPDAPVQIWVIPTQENLMIARDVVDFAS